MIEIVRGPKGHFVALLVGGERYSVNDSSPKLRVIPVIDNSTDYKLAELLILDKKLSECISKYSCKALPCSIQTIEFRDYWEILLRPKTTVRAFKIVRSSTGALSYSFNLQFDLLSWEESCSPSYFFAAFDAGLCDRHLGLIDYDDIDDAQDWGVELDKSNDLPYDPNPKETFVGKLDLGEGEATIAEVFSWIQKQVEEIVDIILKETKTSLATVFEFPDEVRVYCEQYLLYFGQFLMDIGVHASTSLTEEAGQVLFTVTPADEKQALERVRTALDVYLRLPSSPIEVTDHDSVQVQRLEANILRLKSELRLAAAEIQAKQTTIEAQGLIVDVQKRLLTGTVVLDSALGVTTKVENSEEIIGGLVSLGTWREKGIEVHLGEVLRRLKKLFDK